MDVTTSAISKQKTALVVDDSKLARYVLKEMLVDLGIKVEAVESAEEALGSLSAFRPDVIFMDHMMPGMDGFQAVQAIKSDPKTATIPILMYTSKDDGVYVNQARALGAVGVLPKKLKPVQLEKVLVQLKLVTVKESEPVKKASVSTVKVSELPAQSHSLEELARSASEEQEKDSMRLLFRQLFTEQRDSIKQDQWQLVGSMIDQVSSIVIEARNKVALWQVVALSSLFVFLLAIIALLYGLMNSSDLQQQELQYQIDEQKNILLRLEKNIQSAQLNQARNSDNLTNELNTNPIEWAINRNSQVSFYQPLNSAQTQSYMTQLINQLDDFGFNGSLYIQFHGGQFCLEKLEAGQQVLVSSEKPLSQCQFNVQGSNDSTIIGDFENFLASLNQGFPNINIIFESVGSQFTLQEYPEVSEQTTAGEWNSVAKRNNRFNYVLVSER